MRGQFVGGQGAIVQRADALQGFFQARVELATRQVAQVLRQARQIGASSAAEALQIGQLEGQRLGEQRHGVLAAVEDRVALVGGDHQQRGLLRLVVDQRLHLALTGHQQLVRVMGVGTGVAGGTGDQAEIRAEPEFAPPGLFNRLHGAPATLPASAPRFPVAARR